MTEQKTLVAIHHELSMVLNDATDCTNWKQMISNIRSALARRDAQLAAVTQQRDELVEAVVDWHRTNERQDMSIEYLLEECGKKAKAITALAARIQSEQNKGEWIEIEPDGSNLPEGGEDVRWRVCHAGGTQRWAGLPPSQWVAHGEKYQDPYVAYWSIPYIDRRPDIPAYQPKEQDDE